MAAAVFLGGSNEPNDQYKEPPKKTAAAIIGRPTSLSNDRKDGSLLVVDRLRFPGARRLVLPLKFIHPSRGIDELLLTREKRVTA